MYGLLALVVHKRPQQITKLLRTMRAIGVEPQVLTDSEQAFSIIENNKVDGILVDWDADSENSERLVRHVRNSSSNARIPIAMLTATTQTSTIANACRNGATHFVSKPFHAQQLLRNVAAIRRCMLEERRAYQRVDLCTPVHCESEWSHPVLGDSINFSATGMLLYLQPTPSVGEIMRLQFQFDRNGPRFDVQGVVVRCGYGGRIAVLYDPMPRDERRALKRAVEHTWRLTAQ